MAPQPTDSNIFTMIAAVNSTRTVATMAGIGGAAGAVGGILIAQGMGWALELTGSYVPIVRYHPSAGAVHASGVGLMTGTIACFG